MNEYYKKMQRGDIQNTDGSKNPMTEVTGAAVVVPSQRVEVAIRTTDCLCLCSRTLWFI